MSYKIGATLSIGKKDTNQIVINQPGVSGEHAKINILSKDELWIEDCGSSNGTYINSTRIENGIVKPSDRITLAKNTVDITPQLRKIFQALQAEPMVNTVITGNEFTLEINRLRAVHKKFQAEQISITKNHNIKLNLIRAGVGVSASLAAFLVCQQFQAFFKTQEALKVTLTTASGMIGFLAVGGMTAQDKLQQLSNQFQIDYVCPACQGSLNSAVPEVLEKTGHHCKRFKP
jgi:FHA domain